jgi:hypothetical protein
MVQIPVETGYKAIWQVLKAQDVSNESGRLLKASDIVEPLLAESALDPFDTASVAGK